MPAPTISFRNIRKHRSSQNDGFEELTRQLVLLEPPKNCVSIENRGPGSDGGVEILARLADGCVWGWQSKYFLDSFASSEVTQLKKSFIAALRNFPTLKHYCVAIPRNLSGHADGDNDTQTKNWNKFKQWCGDTAAQLGRFVSIELWDESYFITRLQRNDPVYAGIRLYWFDEYTFDTSWFQRQLTKSFAYIGKRYRPDDHVKVATANTINLLRRDNSFEKRLLHVSRNMVEAATALQLLKKRGSEMGPLENHCIKLFQLVNQLSGSFDTCDHSSLYASNLSHILSQISDITNKDPSYYILADSRHEQVQQIDQKSEERIYTYLYSAEIRNEIGDFISNIREAASTFSVTELKLLRRPVLIIDGDAGIGKSHLLADAARTHLAAGKPALFIPARILDRGDRPEQELLRSLDIDDIRFEEFLGALHSAALASNSPALLILDGINESLFARGWEAGLPSLIAQVEKFNSIALCVSVRSSYQELCIRPELDVTRVSHHGFRGQLGAAAKEYLDQNGIERPSAPIFGLNEILYNPLFLSTAVDSMKAEGQVSFPRSLDSIATLISFWLSAVEKNLVTKSFERISLNDGKIPKVIKKIASKMIAEGTEYISYELAHEICEDVVDLAPPARQSDRLLGRLIDEGVLLDFPSLESNVGKRVSFGFQKFSDYLIADAILLDCGTAAVLAEELKSDGKYGYLFSRERFYEFSGPRVALLALTPARLGRELPLIEEGILSHVGISVDEFVSSLSWRKGEEISEETVILLAQLRERREKDKPQLSDSKWFDLLVEMAPLSACPINSSYLKDVLRSMSLGERDATWSVYLIGKAETYDDDWSVVQQLIDWAWVAPKAEIEAEKIHQVAIALALMTSTIDRKLRDCATKALSSLLIKFPDEIKILIDEFADWDDGYVRERVLAAASAGVLYCDNLGILKGAAIAADAMVFRKMPVERHAWTRRYAQIIVNCAVFNNAGLDTELTSRSSPPYPSSPISDWPTLEQVASQSESARSIFRSVIGYIGTPFDGKIPTMAGDFGRYTMGGIDNHFSAIVRGKEKPLSRKEEIGLFLNKVSTFGSVVQGAGAELTSLFEEKKNFGISDILRSFRKYSDYIESDGGASENILAGVISEFSDSDLEIAFEKTQDFFLSLLTDELREEYRRLDPLNGFQEDGIPMFPLLKGQCWLFKRTLELGWQQPLHEKIEKNRLSHFNGRNDHTIERIGKKYQHIAFAELVGYLTDYHWYVDWSKEISILARLEDFERADIDATYLGGSFSKAPETYMPTAIRLPEMTFAPGDPESNMSWAQTLDDIPDPVQFLVQSDENGRRWCLHQGFCRSEDYMKGFESSDPFRSAQYGIELILVDHEDLDKLRNLTTEEIRQNDLDVFKSSWSSPSLFGQRSFRNQASSQPFVLSSEISGVKFGRITEDFSPRYSEYDQSGVSELSNFSTPHPALLEDQKLRPKDPWSNFFVNTEGDIAFSDNPSFLGGIAIIRRDFIEEFSSNRNLKVVWKVWVEKDGGVGVNHFGGRHDQFMRKDYIGFYFEDGGKWWGNLIPFRN